MLSANEIRNVRFSTAMGGYKKEEVDVLLDKIEADYEQFERTLRDMNSKISRLNTELEDCKNSQGNIQNVLISAQKFADQIVEEAKTKSAEIIASAQNSIEKITAQEKELTTAFDKKAGERKSALEKDMENIIAKAEKKHAAVEAATKDCVDRQQLLFDKMKIEVASFKAEITAKYKEHLELLSALPDSMPNDPNEIAQAVALTFEKNQTDDESVQNPEAFKESEQELSDSTEEPAEKLVEEVAGTGFVINADEFDFDEDDSSDDE